MRGIAVATLVASLSLAGTASAALPATLPVQVSPADGSTLLDDRLQLLVENCDPADALYPACDPEGDPLRYEFEIYPDADPGPTPAVAPLHTVIVPQEAGGQTVYDSVFDPGPGLPPRFEEDTWFFWRVRVRDATEVGAWTGFFSFLIDALPPSPDLEGPFGSCFDMVLAVAPTSVTVFDWYGPAGTTVTFDLQIYAARDNPFTGPFLVDLQDIPQDPGGGATTIPFGGATFLEDAGYFIQARRRVDQLESHWAECGFWMNATNEAPGAITILSPTPGTSFPSDTQSVTVTVQNGTDAEGGMPGNAYSIALCASFHSNFRDCDANPANWKLEPSIGDPALTTDISVTQVVDGTLLQPDMIVYLRAWAVDGMDAWGPIDTTDFVIEPGLFDPCSGVWCDTGRECNETTGACDRICEPACMGGRTCEDGTCMPPCQPACTGDLICLDGNCEPDPCLTITCEYPETCDSRTGSCEPPMCGEGYCEGCASCTVADTSPRPALLAGFLLLGLGLVTRRRG